MSSLLLCFLFTSLISLSNSGVNGRSINSFAGPYHIHLSKIYTCTESTSSLTWKYKLVRLTPYNPAKPLELQRLTGNITGTAPINDTYWLRLIVDKLSNNQWKENAFVFSFPSKACSTMLEQTPASIPIFGKLWKSKKNPCEIIAGENELRNTPVSFEFPNFPVFPYFVFRVRFSMNVRGLTEPAVCITVDGASTPVA